MRGPAVGAPPQTAHRVRNGVIEDVAAESVSVGDIVLFRPGELMDVAAKPATVKVRVLPLKKLKDMALVKYSRLSVQPVTEAEWCKVCAMGGLSNPPQA